MEVEGHEEALMDVVVFCKPRPATLKVLFAVAIIPNPFIHPYAYSI
jgi:hypothetical protein